MLNFKLRIVVTLFTLIMVCSGTRALGAEAESSHLSHHDLQRAIVEGLASGRDVTAQLEAFKQQPVPRTRRASRRSSTVAGHVKTQLRLLQQALHHASQGTVSVAALTALEQAYEQAQAAHMLMMAHFESVREDLVASAAPANFERRRRDALARYSATLEAALAPLSDPMAQLRRHPDRDILIASASFQRDLSDAMRETLARLTAQLQDPPPSILRAQTLPVRGATFAPRSPRLEPVLQPVYDQTPAPQPRPADVASTPDAPLSAEIVAQAEALAYDAVRIYEFVRNTIAVEWYAGAMKGAVGTLRQQHGNAIDQASLLMALLRASGVPARYVHGVVRLPIDAVMSSLGLTDSAQATRALTAAGVAYNPVVQGGGVAAVDIESTWVAAYVPYTNYRGTLVDASGPLWIPLMPAFKDTTVTPATNILNAMDLSTADLERDYLSQRQSTDLRRQLEQTVSLYVQANDSASTYAEQLGQRRVAPLPLDLLPSTLPVRVIAVTAEASTLDDAYRHRLRFVVRAGALDQSPIILDHIVPVADVASERLTLSYLPASVEDQRITNRYGGLDNVPAYLIALRPQFKLNGRRLAVATGEIGVGAPYRFELHLLSPAGAEQIRQTLTAGAYHALGVTAQRVTSTEMNPDDPADTETLAAGLLNRVAVDYSAQWTRAEDELAGLLDVALVRPWPALALVSSHYEVETVAGQPQQLLWQGVILDAALRASTPIARDAAAERERDWLRLSALQGSILEHQIFEDLFLVESISADKGLQLAREQGIAIHRIEVSSTLQTLLPSLAHPQAVLDAVADQVTLGYAVELPATEITHESWRGSVWRVTDPATGASGYFIAGGLAGGATSVHPTQWALQILRELLSAPNTPEPNLNPFGAASIVKIADTDGQTGEVTDILATPLAVLIRDAEGKPVKDASVTFTAAMGGARLIALGPSSGTSKEPLPQVVARTDRDGFAQVEVTLGKKTHVNPIYVERPPKPDAPPPGPNAKVHLTQVDATLIEATVVGAEGRVLSIDVPFTVLAYPKAVNRLRFTKVNRVTDLDDTAQFLLTDASIRALEQQGMPPEALGYLQAINNQVIVGEQVLIGLLHDTIGEPLTQQYKNYMLSAFQQGHALVPIYTPGASEVAIFVQAVDRYGNPVSNVEVEFASPIAAWSPPRCDDPPRYVPTHVVGRHNFDACPIDQPHFAGDCGDRLYRDTTTVVGIFVNLITALGTEKDKLTIHAPKEPDVAPITFSYLLNPDMVCSTVRQCFIQQRKTTDHMGHNLHAARVGTESPYPMRFYLYCGSAKSGYTPIEAKGGVWGYINGWIQPSNQPRIDLRGCWEDPGDEIHDPNDKDCIRDNPMTYQGHGLYQALITTHPSPGANDVAVVTYETQEDFDRREDRLTRLIATTIDGVAGVDLEINELISLGVPTPQRTDVIHLDEQNQTPYYVHLPYTIKPTEYWAQTVEIDLFEERVEGGQEPEDDKVRRYTWTGSSRFGEGHVLIPRTTAFDASKLITAQLVLNRGAPFEVRSDYFPVPILAKLISDASKQLYVAHHLDLVNEHSCVQSTPFTFTLGDDARVSLVFADADNPGQVYKILDNQQFDKGTHTLPFYLPAVQALLPDNTASYALEPGTYAFALTAVNIVKDEKNRDVAVGGALFEYLPNTLPVGRTLVRDVDVSNGNLILSTTDLHVPGRGVPLEFNRTYSANTSNVPGELGVGWRHNYRSRVIQDACDGVIVTGGAGDGSRFVKKDGQWQPLNGYHGTLKVDEINDTYDFYSPDGTQYHYENVHDLGAYHLIYISDPNGNTTKLGYDPDDKTRARLLTVEDASGRPLTFTYEEKTFNIPGTAKTTRVITRIEGPGAMSVDFEYDADGNLIQVAREEGARMDTYTYTPDRVVEIPDANAVARLHSKLETYTNPNGQITTYIYGDQVYRTTAVDTTIHLPPAQNGQTSQLKKTLTVPYPYTHVAQIDAPGMGLTQFAYNALARTTTVTNDRGADTTYTMDATGAVIQVDDPVGATRTVWESEHRRPKQRINARGVQTDYTYDSNGNLLSERIDGFATTYTYHSLREGLIKNRIASQTDRNGHTTQFTYDSAGNLRTVTDAAGGVIQHTYASNGDRLSTRDPNGHTTRYDYDPYGNVNTVTAPLGHVTTTQWDVRSRATAITRPGNQLYHYRYDSLNRMISQTNPMGGARTWTYDAMGNKLSDTDEAGRQTRFNYDAANRLTRVTNALDDSRIITYDTQGNKTSERDFRGHLTTFEYDLADRLTRRIEPLNRITLWQYDPVGNPVSETDALGRITRFEYDSLGQRLQTTDVLGDITTTVYDGEGNLIEQTDANGHTTLFLYDGLNQLIERRQPLGRHTTYAYDASGNRTEEIDAHGHRAQWTYDALNRLMRRTNALDHTTGYEYDPAGNLTREIDARLNTVEHEYDALNRRTSTTDAEGYRTAYAYDAVGNRIRETRANGNVMEWEYDDLNRPTRQRDNLGTVTRFAYDAEGNRIAVTDANGHTTTQVYDALNQLTEKQLPANRTLRFRYDPVGNKIAETDANGYITELAYDALNRVVTLTDPLDATSHRDYDAVGNLIRQTDPRGSTTDFDYDALNQLVATTDALGQTLRVTYDQVSNRVSETDKRGIITTFTYDLANQLLSTVRAGVTLRTLEYDAVGNVLSETDANGHTTVFVYDRRNLVTRESRPLAAITEHTYDSGGDRIETVDPEGRTTSWTYDERRRQLSATNGDGETTTFEYDGTGHRTRLERPEGNAWRFTYDAANRLTEVLDPEQGATTYTYDGNDNRLTQSDAKQQTTTFSYDDLNRLTQIQAADGTTTTYIYDAAGNRTEEIDANGQLTTHAYDALNRLTRTTYANVLTPTGDDLQQIDYGYDPNDNLFDVTEIYSGTSGVRVTTRSYDDFNRMLTVTDPEGHILTYNYDAVGNRLTLTAPARVTRYVYDALNRVESVITPQGVTEYLYDRSGRLTQTKYPTGAATVTAYDAAGRIETIQHTQQATPVSSYVYAYDANGNRLEERERRGGTEMLTTYRYDVVDRLEETTAGGRLTIYTYDAVSNRLSEHRTSLSDGSVAVDRSYAYNPRNQLTELRDELDPTLSVTFGYDANGNRTSQSTSTSTTTYVYDSRNQLRRLTQGGSSLGEFLYDWQGLRVRKQTLSETRHYVYDDQSVLLTTDDTGTIDSHYIYGPGHLLALDHVTQGPQYYLFDALGSVVGLIKPDGSLQSRYAYDAWGNVEDEAGDSANRFGFTGHELDSESGLYYAKARYYDPFVGLFLSEDPLLGNPLTPLSLHRYLYAYQNPLVYIDPDGEESISTLIDQAAEDCGFWICLGLAFTKGTYYAATLGFVGMHDPISDERDEGRVSSRQYWTHGVGGGLAVAGFNALSGRVGGAITQAATTLSKRLAVGAAVGAISSLGDDALNQSINISAGLQDEFSVSQNLKAASLGAVVETGSTVLGHSAANRSRQASRADRSSVSPERSRNVNQVQESSSTSSAAAVAENPAAPGTGAVDTLKTVDDYLRAVEDLDVSTAKNEAVFYSGRGNRELAEEFAIQNKRKTIEMTDGGKWLEQQNLYSRNSPLTPTEADEVWISLSRKYAEGASGNTFGFAEGARPQSIFNTVEYPTLLKNPNVTNTITGGY